MAEHALDIAIIGGGAAGLAAGIFAGVAGEKARSPLRVVILEGAKFPGAKILISGGGRCNVTNERMTTEDFSGGSHHLIRNVLRAFDEHRTLEWMQGMGVPLKLEPTGKWFPVSDKARTILDALLGRLAEVGVELRMNSRVESVFRDETGGFLVTLRNQPEPLRAKRVIMATGGLALPKSGSDGAGLSWMRLLGHAIVPTTPALAPLVLAPPGPSGPRSPGDCFEEFSGITLNARLTLWSREKKRIAERTGSLVFTHFGISGPAAMDLSRHIARRRLEYPHDPGTVTFGHPDFPTAESADEWLRGQVSSSPRLSTTKAVSVLYPERMARALANGVGRRLADLSRDQRLLLARRLSDFDLPVAGDRGYSFAETTAGGVDLKEVDIRRMESKLIPGLFLCGEILDVDGRIGGFNFQWAWATGYLAGRAAVASLDV